MSFQIETDAGQSKASAYQLLFEQAQALLGSETDEVANAANFSSLVYHALPDLNWAGFYLLKQGELVVGPFQGQPACVRIALGKGVCGTAAQSRQTVVVEDVDQFPGHIVCDAASRSEIVVPVLRDGELYGVFDVDSPRVARFDNDDRVGMEALVACFAATLDHSP